MENLSPNDEVLVRLMVVEQLLLPLVAQLPRPKRRAVINALPQLAARAAEKFPTESREAVMAEYRRRAASFLADRRSSR